jgi:PIN domain nuclease of toxin-antitoxin system
MDRLLLDTCALLWLAEGAPMAPEARRAIAAGLRHVSPITAWEIANLARKHRIALVMPVRAWITQAFTAIDVRQPELTTALLIESCGLPGAPPDDPADRIIIATAREHQLTIVTRDIAILAYAQRGHAKAMRC